MKTLVTIVVLLMTSVGYSQKYDVQGQLADTLGGPLPSATVLLLAASDSSLVNFTLTDSDGSFRFKNLAAKEYFLKVSYVGFRTVMQRIHQPATGNLLDLGRVKMLPATSELEAIEIAAERAPVTIKKDTIEFNAGSFRTKQNAMVEDLLKKLPGVEVDNDGNVTAQGERVKRVTVDGKNFFGADPKIATKNLPADAIDKVQVFDKKSDQATFTGIDDGQREKTINLELKEEKRNGAFGTLMAGVGTDDRFQGRASVNKFSKDRQLSLLGMGNNVNESGFSMDEYMNFTGGSQQMMSGGAVRLEFGSDNQNGVPLNFGNRANGIMTTYAAGLNYNDELSKKSEVNGSYFFNYIDHNREQLTERENFLPGGSFTFNQNSRQNNYNTNHRVNASLEQKLDSMNSIKFTTNMSLNSTETNLDSKSESRNGDNEIQNESTTRSLASGQNNSLTSSLLWRHKFNKKGRTLSTNLQYGISQNDRDGYLNSINEFYVGDEPLTQNLEQESIQKTHYKSYAGSISYTEPLGKRRYLEANYSYRANLNDVDRKVFDVNNEESVLNTQLTNVYNSTYEYHKAGLNFRMVKPKFNLVAGTSVQNTKLAGRIITADTKVDCSFENILPSLRFNYDFSNTRHLRLDYETDVQEPSIQQLQPVIDNSDP
ncbi:MAG TPA: TonB-dependent receptor, partial [Chryseosolibacter sp.]|nr:TonB-dependent receptor [Chryseosolibacter sp.]